MKQLVLFTLALMLAMSCASRPVGTTSRVISLTDEESLLQPMRDIDFQTIKEEKPATQGGSEVCQPM